ncbi:MAG: hypothetical protein K9W43_04685 [Candidatus Thorarchaeota archaeon]|nr:hypothetical protein [Candidatus Thorarchaeota archaeon]
MVLVELAITFFAMGLLIIVYTAHNIMKLRQYSEFETKLADAFDTTDLDLTGETAYVRCISHEWAMDNISRRKYGKFSKKFHELMTDNTLFGAMLVGIFAGTSSILIGLSFVEGSSVLGASLGVILIGIVVLIGPGDPKVSSTFLDDLMKTDMQNLCKEDYVYVHLAVNSITEWLKITAIIGAVFIIISPWAEMVPTILAGSLTFVVTTMIFNPALAIAAVNFPLAFLYMTMMAVLLFYFIPRTIIRRIRHTTKEKTTSDAMAHW